MKVRWHGHPAEPSFETAIQQAVNGTPSITRLAPANAQKHALLFVTPDMKAQKKIDVKGKNRDELMRMPIRDLKQVHMRLQWCRRVVAQLDRT